MAPCNALHAASHSSSSPIRSGGAGAAAWEEAREASMSKASDHAGTPASRLGSLTGGAAGWVEDGAVGGRCVRRHTQLLHHIAVPMASLRPAMIQMPAV